MNRLETAFNIVARGAAVGSFFLSVERRPSEREERIAKVFEDFLKDKKP